LLALSELARRSRQAVGPGPARKRCLEVVEAFVRASGEAQDGFSDEGIGFRTAMEGELELHDHPLRRCFRHVGAGIARAWGREAPWPAAPWLWLEADGLGFAEGLLRTRRSLRHPSISPAQVWSDHGLGRALWFHGGGSPSVARLIEAVASTRRPAIWAGLGLASTFTGGGPSGRLESVGGEAFGAGARFGEALRASLDGGAPPFAQGFHAPLAAALGDDGVQRGGQSP